MTENVTAQEPLDFGGVWALTGRILRHMVWPLTVMGVALFAIPNTLFSLVMSLVFSPLLSFADRDPEGAMLFARAIGVARMAFPLFAIYLLQAAVSRHVFAQREGRNASIGDSLMFALRRAGPALGLALIVFICVLGGAFLLIIPGVLIWVAWAMSAPVMQMEGTSLNASLERSATLTRGNRGVIFSTHLVLFLAMLGSVILLPVASVMYLAPALNLAPESVIVPTAVVVLALQTLIAVAFTAVTTATYIKLTGLGRDSDATVEVFA